MRYFSRLAVPPDPLAAREVRHGRSVKAFLFEPVELIAVNVLKRRDGRRLRADQLADGGDTLSDHQYVKLRRSALVEHLGERGSQAAVAVGCRLLHFLNHDELAAGQDFPDLIDPADPKVEAIHAIPWEQRRGEKR